MEKVLIKETVMGDAEKVHMISDLYCREGYGFHDTELYFVRLQIKLFKL